MSSDLLTSFAITILISGSVVNASVVRTQTKDILAVNGRLYDPDLFSSLYQETSRRNRLYLVPGLTKMGKELENDSFGIPLLEKTEKDSSESVTDDMNDITQTNEFLNLKEENDERFSRETKQANELHTAKLQNGDLVSKVSDGVKNNKKMKSRYFRSRLRPIVRRTLLKVPRAQGKRYKAGVVDRIAHGFGKRSPGSRKLGDLVTDILGDPELLTEELKEYIRGYTKANGDSRRLSTNPEYVHIANLVRVMDGYRKNQGSGKYLQKSDGEVLEDIIDAFVNKHGHGNDAVEGGNILL